MLFKESHINFNVIPHLCGSQVKNLLHIYIYIYIYGLDSSYLTLSILYYSIFFNWMQILTNLPLDYIIFVYSPYLQNFKMIKDQ